MLTFSWKTISDKAPDEIGGLYLVKPKSHEGLIKAYLLDLDGKSKPVFYTYESISCLSEQKMVYEIDEIDSYTTLNTKSISVK